MKERPILMSAPMVRALLAGTKTQTRRVMKPQPHPEIETKFPFGKVEHGYAIWTAEADKDMPRWMYTIKSPYGKPGDRLWVRETFCQYTTKVYTSKGMTESGPQALYRADGGTLLNGYKWKPSIFMPRWASRLTLEVTEVRVQRLQEISEEDAKAEGANGGCTNCGESPCHPGCVGHAPDFKDDFASIWMGINGSASWHANPWVWAITFPATQERAHSAKSEGV